VVAFVSERASKVARIVLAAAYARTSTTPHVRSVGAETIEPRRLKKPGVETGPFPLI